MRWAKYWGRRPAASQLRRAHKGVPRASGVHEKLDAREGVVCALSPLREVAPVFRALDQQLFRPCRACMARARCCVLRCALQKEAQRSEPVRAGASVRPAVQRAAAACAGGGGAHQASGPRGRRCHPRTRGRRAIPSSARPRGARSARGTARQLTAGDIYPRATSAGGTAARPASECYRDGGCVQRGT